MLYCSKYPEGGETMAGKSKYTFDSKIHVYRATRRMTQQDLADLVGVSRQTIMQDVYKRQPYDTFKHFGFQSGRDVDKFADWPDELRTQNGVRYIGQHVNAVLSARVIDARDCGTQMLYIAEVVEAQDVYKRQVLNARLLLADCVRSALATCLNILGVSAPERM